jgi:hypothetical protein
MLSRLAEEPAHRGASKSTTDTWSFSPTAVVIDIAALGVLTNLQHDARYTEPTSPQPSPIFASSAPRNHWIS